MRRRINVSLEVAVALPHRPYFPSNSGKVVLTQTLPTPSLPISICETPSFGIPANLPGSLVTSHVRNHSIASVLVDCRALDSRCTTPRCTPFPLSCKVPVYRMQICHCFASQRNFKNHGDTENRSALGQSPARAECDVELAPIFERIQHHHHHHVLSIRH